MYGHVTAAGLGLYIGRLPYNSSVKAGRRRCWCKLCLVLQHVAMATFTDRVYLRADIAKDTPACLPRIFLGENLERKVLSRRLNSK
jgi:hypothetical protein